MEEWNSMRKNIVFFGLLIHIQKMVGGSWYNFTVGWSHFHGNFFPCYLIRERNLHASQGPKIQVEG